MLYSKGDTIKFEDGRIALVLDNGIRGKEFVVQYVGQEIQYFNSFIRRRLKMIVGESWAYSPNDALVEEVWYTILVGDQQGWTEERRLVEANRGIHKKKEIKHAVQ